MWDLWVAGAAAPAFEGFESWRFHPRLRLPEGFSRHLDTELCGRETQVLSGTDKMCYITCK